MDPDIYAKFNSQYGLASAEWCRDFYPTYPHAVYLSKELDDLIPEDMHFQYTHPDDIFAIDLERWVNSNLPGQSFHLGRRDDDPYFARGTTLYLKEPPVYYPTSAKEIAALLVEEDEV